MTLKELIREVAERGDTNGPRELAELVAKTASAKQIRDFFIEAIVDDCRQYLIGQRSDAIDGIRRTNHSARLSRQRDWYAKFLNAQEHITNGIWKQLGDCTVDDLQLSIKERQVNIERLQARVVFHEQLLALMVHHDATHVRDLPRDVIESEFA